MIEGSILHFENSQKNAVFSLHFQSGILSSNTTKNGFPDPDFPV